MRKNLKRRYFRHINFSFFFILFLAAVTVLAQSEANTGSQSFKILKTRNEGFNAKVKALLGRELTDKEIQAQNPYLELKTDLLPKLDDIWVSTLVYKHDFYGTIISRLLKLHADQGARVRVLVTESLLNIKYRVKDRAQLRDLERYSPLIKVYRYRFNDNRLSFTAFHRTLHAKVLVTHSVANPDTNTVILGGRNIADEFLFLKKPDYSQYPKLIQYLKKEDRFVPFEDLEYEVHSASISRYFATQLEALAHKTPLADTGFHDSSETDYIPFISIPYVDNLRLRDAYVKAIDEANSNIKIVTPYFFPEQKIEEALIRAIYRGVRIKIITQTKLTGDDFPKIMENINKVSINKYSKIRFEGRVEFYAWKPRGMIIHSKVMIIDTMQAFVGSINFDSRSFIHDIEVGYHIQKRDTVLELLDRFKEYLTFSERIFDRFDVMPFHHVWIQTLNSVF